MSREPLSGAKLPILVLALGRAVFQNLGRLFLMNLANYQTMDPHLLVGLINTELRNHAEDLPDLCKTHGLDEVSLRERLAQGGYEWQASQKQFR